MYIRLSKILYQEMESRIDISAQMATIKKLAVNLCNIMLPIMKQLLENDNDFTDEIIHNLDMTKDKEAEVNLWLQNYCENLISEAVKYKNEVDKFHLAYKEGEETLEKNIREYPLLSEVWYGDTYGESGVDGLDMLIKELEKDIRKADESKIIESACKHKF